MRKLVILVVVFVFIQAGLPGLVWAKPSQVQRVKISTDGAMVLNRPTFNGDVTAYLPAGKTFWISKKKVNSFHKIAISPKVYGWIVDVDVRTYEQIAKSGAEENVENPDDITQVLSEEEKDEEIYFTRYVGPVVATVDFREKTFAGKKSDDLLMYGVKISGPNVLFEGPSLTSFNLLLHAGAPDYYESLTNNDASGWLLLADFLLTAPFYGGSNYMVYYSLGPLVRWNQFTVKAGGSTLDLQDIHLGATVELGAALQAGPVAVRAEYRYFWEVTQYRALSLAVQMKF